MPEAGEAAYLNTRVSATVPMTAPSAMKVSDTLPRSDAITSAREAFLEFVSILSILHDLRPGSLTVPHRSGPTVVPFRHTHYRFAPFRKQGRTRPS